MITIIPDGKNCKVKLEGKIVGAIKQVKGGFQYFPKGSKNGGEVFPLLRDCVRSLQDN